MDSVELGDAIELLHVEISPCQVILEQMPVNASLRIDFLYAHEVEATVEPHNLNFLSLSFI